MFQPGESTLALDEEMLQVLDAVDPEKPAANNAMSQCLVPVADRETNTGQGHHLVPRIQEKISGRSGDCNRPGWTADCKDLAQRLLFSEDLEEAEQAQRGPENTHSSPTSACINGLISPEIKSGPHGGSSTK